MIEEHISKPRLMFENYPTFLVADTNCFVNHLNGLKAIVGSQCFTLIVPLIGKLKEHQRGDLLIFNRTEKDVQKMQTIRFSISVSKYPLTLYYFWREVQQPRYQGLSFSRLQGTGRRETLGTRLEVQLVDVIKGLPRRMKTGS